MGEPNPCMSFRGPQDMKDAIELLAQRQGKKPGNMIEGWVRDRLAQELAMEVARPVGFAELSRRLAVPTYPSTRQDQRTGIAVADGVGASTLSANVDGRLQP